MCRKLIVMAETYVRDSFLYSDWAIRRRRKVAGGSAAGWTGHISVFYPQKARDS